MSPEGGTCQHAIPPAQQHSRPEVCWEKSEDVEISRGIREAFKEPFGFQGSVTSSVVSASLLLSQPSLWHALVAY